MTRMNPKGVLGGEKPRLIDEWQKAPDIWNQVKDDLDFEYQFGKYILTGSRSAKISLAPGDYAGAEFTPITVKNDGDTIAAYVYSAVYARIKLGVKLDSDLYESSVFSLKPGWNKVEWLIGAENETSLKRMKLSEFTIR